MEPHCEESSLSLALKKLVIPRVEKVGMAKVFTALPHWKNDMELPEGITVVQQMLVGARTPARRQRLYGGAGLVEAEWLADGVYSARTPKLYFVLEGEVALKVADYVVHCRAGHVILVPPGTPFSNGDQVPVDEAKPYRSGIKILMLIPYHGGLSCWLSYHWRDEKAKWQIVEESSSIPYSGVSFYLDQLVREATNKGINRRLVCESLLKIVVALLHRELQELPLIQTGEIKFVQPEASAGQKEYSISQALKYIDINLRESLSIDKVARFVCMSRTVFTEQFRVVTGKTFAQYVTDVRFAEAMKLMKESDLAVGQVCCLIGMKPCRLRNLFEERESCSPTDFRKKYRSVQTVVDTIGR
jgi:AraC-like DNA-binding protein